MDHQSLALICALLDKVYHKISNNASTRNFTPTFCAQLVLKASERLRPINNQKDLDMHHHLSPQTRVYLPGTISIAMIMSKRTCNDDNCQGHYRPFDVQLSSALGSSTSVLSPLTSVRPTSTNNNNENTSTSPTAKSIDADANAAAIQAVGQWVPTKMPYCPSKASKKNWTKTQKKAQ